MKKTFALTAPLALALALALLPSAPAKASSLAYLGGPVLQTPRVEAVFLGSKWQASPSWRRTRAELKRFLAAYSGSPWALASRQFGATGLINYMHARTLPIALPSFTGSDQYAEHASITSLLSLQPHSSAPTTYLVFASARPRSFYCGWHGYTSLTRSPSSASTLATIAVILDASVSACSPGPSAARSQHGRRTENMASITAHELNDLITDPFYTGWRTPAAGPASLSFQEPSDFCRFAPARVYRFPDRSRWLMQPRWDEARSRCF